MDPREEAFEALEAVQRECMVYLADHSESQGAEGSLADSEDVWQRALAHVLGSKDWWDAHYRETTTTSGPPAPLCSEVMRRTLRAYAAISFTAVDEMQRQQVEWRLFGEVTRPEESSREWAALAAIGAEVRSAVCEGRCPDDTEAFNAWSVVSFYIGSTRRSLSDADARVAEKRLRPRDLVAFPLPRGLMDREPTDGADTVTDPNAPADDRVVHLAGSRWMRARRKPKLRDA